MHEDNVVSLHCKAGKGRAGIMAACLMVRLGETASASVSKFDETRVSDLKGLTVVNQRKWPFLYERLVKELWGVQNSIGLVPGKDPDLTAPASRVACVREISIHLQPKTKGGKRNDKILPSLSCAVFQQEPTGKTLVHRAKMVLSEPEDGDSGSVYAAALPRSAVVQGTFQVLIASAVGAAATQKHVLDLWWTTTFLAPEGGDHAFGLTDMDVFSMKLATRLQEAGARVVLRHTHPHAESPRRRSALKRLPAGSETTGPEEGGGAAAGEDSAQGEETSESSQVLPTAAAAAGAAPTPDGKASGEPRQDPSTAQGAAEKNDNATTTGKDAGEGARDQKGPDGGGVSTAKGGSQIDSAGAKTDITTANGSDVTTGEKSARTAPVMNKQKPSISGPSPAFPGPSPAGLASPVWTFEGRTPSVRDDPAGRAIEDSRWTRTKMWNSNPGVSSGGASTPTAAASLKPAAPAADRGTGLRAKRRTAQRQRSRSDSIGSSQSGMHSALSGGSGPVRAGSTWSAVYGGDSGGGESGDKSASGEGERQGQGRQGRKGFPFHQHHRETDDSDSDDQLAVRASAFGRQSTTSGGGGVGSGGGGQTTEAQFAPHGPPTGTSSTQGEQWVMEMEMSFAQERSGWEEHRHCLETELDWALAARARAEARSEEDSARVEVLENRLSAWRSEYSMIERDVKQAVKLLEMSLSGLMSAESALKRWKAHIPQKAYEDIMACLTKGEMAHRPAASEQE
eukprot:jgi/Undpi1/1664/HiC_scaffold_11.g05054.m1